jgi:hypothetical protein
MNNVIKSTLFFFTSITCLSAQTVLINFGDKAYDGTQAPGHAIGGATGTTWNTLANDALSGILDENGNSTGVQITFGTSSLTSTTVTYNNNTKTSNPANVDPDVVGSLFDTPLGLTNAVRNTSTLDGVAVNVTGLSAGTYEFYLTVFRGDNGNDTRTFNVYTGTSSDPITDFSTASSQTINNSSISVANGWLEDVNYITGSFTIDGTTDNLSILVTCSGYVGVLTSLEVVQVPEANTAWGAGAAGALIILLGLRRFRRS